MVQVSSPTLIVERAGSNAWTHKSWRVREEFAKTVTTAINLFASTELPLQRAILPPVCHLQVFYKSYVMLLEIVILTVSPCLQMIRYYRCYMTLIQQSEKLLFYVSRLVRGMV